MVMPFDQLPDVLLARVLAFSAPRDLEAATVASKAVAQLVVPHFPLWKALFCYRWSMLNFALDDVDDNVDPSDAPPRDDEQKQQPLVPIEIDLNLRALFPSGCTESRMFQLLAHAVTPVPSYADTRTTMRYRSTTRFDHTVVPLGPPRTKSTLSMSLRPHWRRIKASRPLDFAFAGSFLGGDRCVRANAPFQTTFHVQVYKVRVPPSTAQPSPAFAYRVGVTASGYFELSISRRVGTTGAGNGVPHHRVEGTDMTAIGLGTQHFRLIGKQPGWTNESFGYHGDDGHIFHGSGRGHPFGPSFDVGDTVGCGVRRNVQDQRSFVFFTNTGDVIPTGDRGIECEHDAWFPVVGLDSANAIHVNYGQEPFCYDSIVDDLFRECRGMTSILANQLQWYDINESDMEDDDASSVDTNEYEMMGAHDDDNDDDDDDDMYDDERDGERDDEEALEMMEYEEMDAQEFLQRLMFRHGGRGGAAAYAEDDDDMEEEAEDDDAMEEEEEDDDL